MNNRVIDIESRGNITSDCLASHQNRRKKEVAFCENVSNHGRGIRERIARQDNGRSSGRCRSRCRGW